MSALHPEKPTALPRLRYATLDGLRGVAAFMVVINHITTMRDAPRLTPHGYLSVDFFFMLSGFIIATIYEKKLTAGLRFFDFIQHRLIRLYPIALFGLLLGCLKFVLQKSVHPDGSGSNDLIVFLNLVLIPNWSDQFWGELFPADIPIWSLFLEIIVNIIWYLLLASLRFRTPHLVATVVIAGVILLYFATTVPDGISELGPYAKHPLGAAARTAFPFFLGALLSRSHLSLTRFAYFSRPPLLVGMLVVVTGMQIGGTIWDLLSVYFFLPLILVGGIAGGMESRAPIRDFMGAISYPLYAVHFPIFLLLSGFRHAILPTLGFWPTAGFAILGSVLAASLLERYYERPVRAYLSSLLPKRDLSTVGATTDARAMQAE
jgi:peptidoglycan/LPS O-acetylase OafA/YrhL